MKAARVERFGGPEVLSLADLPDPKAGPGELCIRVHAIGVNPVETYIRSGAYGRLPSLPYTPGTDAAGVVESLGGGVERFRVGDRVYTHGSITGAYAERLVALESQVQLLPDNASFEQGAALGIPFATAHRALFGRASVRAGETVLVHGASGGVGLAAVQWARAAGCRVAGTAGTEAGCQLVRAQGADLVLNHRTPDYLAALPGWTAGRGVDVIVEMAAHINLARDLGILDRSGRVVVVGNRGPIEINARDIMARDADIRGMILANAADHELLAIHDALRAGIVRGELRPVIGVEMGLADARRAHVLVMEDGKLGKIVLKP